MTELTSPDRKKAAIINDISKRNQTVFQEWKPSGIQPTIPNLVLNYLIPTRLLQLSDDPTKVAVIIDENTTRTVRFFVLEHKDSPVSNSASLSEYFTKLDHAMRVRGIIVGQQRPPLPEIPDNVDELHVRYESYLNKLITVNDRLLLYVDLARVAANQVHVTSYNDRPDLHRMGVATEFYERLQAIGRKLGWKYITGANSRGNIDFFKEKLGRSWLTDLPQDVQDEITTNLSPTDVQLRAGFRDITVTCL